MAVKVLPESFASDETRLERFQREAKALATPSHPNLLDIYDVGTTDGIHYAVTELLEGDTLREWITPSGLPWKKVTSISAAVPVDLERAVHRCLEKRPEARFQSAADLAYSLKSVGSSPSSPVIAMPSTVTSVAGRRRSRWLIPVVIAGVILAAITSWWALNERGVEEAPVVAASVLDPGRIAVVPFANPSDDPSYNALGRRIAGRIIEELADIDELEAVPINAVSGIVQGRAPVGAEARAIVHDVAVAISASLVVTGVMYSSKDEIELQATLENAISGSAVRGFDTLRTTPQDLDSAIEKLAGWIYVTTMEELHPPLRFGAGDRIPDPVAFREYVTGLPNLGLKPEAGERLTRALEIDPKFERLRLFRAFSMWGLDWWTNSDMILQPLEARRSELTPGQQTLMDGIRWGLDGRWGGALSQFQEYAEEHPDDCMAESAVILVAVHANRLHQALQIGDRATAEKMSQRLAAVDEPFTMGGPSFGRAAIAAQLGERGEAIRLLQQAITRGFFDYRRLHVDINFDPIRDNPEFQEILRPKG